MLNPVSMTIILIFAVGVFAAPGGYALYRYLQARKRADTSATWQTAPGRITRADVDTQETRDNDGGLVLVYIPRIAYEYEATDMTYEGTRVSYGANTLSKPQADDILARYPLGAPVTVHYDPASPFNSVLQPAAPRTTPWLVAAVVFFVLALCGLLVFGQIVIRSLQYGA